MIEDDKLASREEIVNFDLSDVIMGMQREIGEATDLIVAIEDLCDHATMGDITDRKAVAQIHVLIKHYWVNS